MGNDMSSNMGNDMSSDDSSSPRRKDEIEEPTPQQQKINNMPMGFPLLTPEDLTLISAHVKSTRPRSARVVFNKLTKLRCRLKNGRKRVARVLQRVNDGWADSPAQAALVYLKRARATDLQTRVHQSLKVIKTATSPLSTSLNVNTHGTYRAAVHKLRENMTPAITYTLHKGKEHSPAWLLRENSGGIWGELTPLTMETKLDSSGDVTLYRARKPKKYEYEDYHKYDRVA